MKIKMIKYCVFGILILTHPFSKTDAQAGLAVQSILKIGGQMLDVPGLESINGILGNKSDAAMVEVMGRQLAEQEKIRKESQSMKEKLKSVLQETREFKGDIEDVREAMLRAEEMAKDVRKIKDLKIGNFTFVAENYLGESLDPLDYIPRIPETDDLRKELRHSSRQNAVNEEVIERIFGESIHQLILEIEKGKKNEDDVDEFVEAVEENYELQESLEIYKKKRTLEMAIKYNRLADQLSETASNTLAALTEKGKLEMSEGIRLQNMQHAYAMMERALEYREKADALLAEYYQRTPGEIDKMKAYDSQIRAVAYSKLSYDDIYGGE